MWIKFVREEAEIAVDSCNRRFRNPATLCEELEAVAGIASDLVLEPERTLEGLSRLKDCYSGPVKSFVCRVLKHSGEAPLG